MAYLHNGWETLNSEGIPEYERLEELADGKKTPRAVSDILNREYKDRPKRTPNSVRKKCRRMGLELRKNAEHEYTNVAVITEREAVHDDLVSDKDVTIAVINDLQTPYHDPLVLSLVYKVLNEVIQPDELYMLGDIYDFYPISSYSKSVERRSQWSLWDEIQESRQVVEQFRNVKGLKRVRLFGGNHEDRLRRYLIDRAPELIGIPELEIHRLLGFDKRDYLPYTSDEFHVRNNLLFHHGHVTRKHAGYSAKAHVEQYGMSIIHGHCHRGGRFETRKYREDLVGQENFCLCDLNPGYTRFPDWAHGFSVVYLNKNNKRFHIDPFPISGGGMMYYGDAYTIKDLTDEEKEMFVTH